MFPSHDPVAFEIVVKDKSVEIKARDKTTVFLTDPDKYMTREALLKALTEELPGNVIERFVPGRGVRQVFMMPLPYYIWETWLGLMVRWWQSQEKVFTLTDEQGRFLADHTKGVAESSQYESIIVGVDYSSYDQTEKFKNVRALLLEYVCEWLDLHDYDYKIGPWDNPKELITILWNKTNGAAFQVDQVIYLLNQVFSGEFMTILINNWVNKANNDYTIKQMSIRIPTFSKFMSMYHKAFMGDDSIMIIKGGTSVENLVASMAEVVTEAANDNGSIVTGKQ